jgi:hypothetical protein
MQAMGFRAVFQAWLAILHREAICCFPPLQPPPSSPASSPSGRGTPWPSISTLRLEANLFGLLMAYIREATFDYINDANLLGSNLSDIVKVETITQGFTPVLWIRIRIRSDPELLAGSRSGKNHSGSRQLQIRNEFETKLL